MGTGDIRKLAYFEQSIDPNVVKVCSYKKKILNTRKGIKLHKSIVADILLSLHLRKLTSRSVNIKISREFSIYDLIKNSFHLKIV